MLMPFTWRRAVSSSCFLSCFSDHGSAVFRRAEFDNPHVAAGCSRADLAGRCVNERPLVMNVTGTDTVFTGGDVAAVHVEVAGRR
jgi:hypothetical protein